MKARRLGRERGPDDDRSPRAGGDGGGTNHRIPSARDLRGCKHAGARDPPNPMAIQLKPFQSNTFNSRNTVKPVERHHQETVTPGTSSGRKNAKHSFETRHIVWGSPC